MVWVQDVPHMYVGTLVSRLVTQFQNVADIDPIGTDFWGHHLLHGLPWCENPQQGSSPPSHAFHTMIF